MGAPASCGQAMLLPLVTFAQIDLERANACLVQWGHKMGALARGHQAGTHFALYHDRRPVALAMTSTLIRECVGGGLNHLTRANTCARYSRWCAICSPTMARCG